MYAELLKLIEGGVNNNSQKVINYSNKLAEILKNEGQINISNKINRILTANNTRLSSLDSLTAKPFDKDSKLEMVEVTIPTESREVLFFDSIIEKEIETFLLSIQNKEDFLEVGLEIDNRLLLHGPPGTGKTSLAKYISLQTNLPLITVRLDAMISSLLGNTAKNIRKVFEFAAKQSCILFLDEFDVLAKVRDDKNELGELKRVVNSLLQNIDAFSDDSVIIAATNHSKLLDEAVWRRFDTIISLTEPDFDLRKEMIIAYSSILPSDYTDNERKMRELANIMDGFSPADIKNVIQKVAKKALITNRNELLYSQIVYQVISKSTINIKKEALISDMLKYNVTQKEVSEILDVSLRQVRNVVKGVQEHV
ncbi:AAA family ATPase [Gracilibacillus phocaeensis]|uniref:AAA family ATPase n=1 Tax=Gracilibacillus phocaeensis TaxID=2042304 RepID=UPI0010323568|nr:ATP-binding protein [Gracilibacillus phocaeensis]